MKRTEANSIYYKNRLSLFIIILLTTSSCMIQKEESCLYQTVQPPYTKIDLIICNDGTRLERKSYSSTACDQHDGIEGVYNCEPI